MRSPVSLCVPPHVHARRLMMRIAATLALVAAMAGCGPLGDPSKPIPTALIPAQGKAERLVVVLPGRGDDLAALRRSGMVEAIHEAWPDADVLLAELAIRYYQGGDAAKRLHDEVVAPARTRGYREVWLGGASMGGMGTLLYDKFYPGDADGLFLLAPYLGDRPILEEIMRAGGVAQWDPGPVQEMSDNTWQRELWRHIQSWQQDPAKARNVWMATGDRDRLRDANAILAPVLPPDQVLVRPGGHDWTVWTPATREILIAADGARGRD
jgi:hypothetical protein